jgi:hypothetical protein
MIYLQLQIKHRYCLHSFVLHLEYKIITYLLGTKSSSPEKDVKIERVSDGEDEEPGISIFTDIF